MQGGLAQEFTKMVTHMPGEIITYVQTGTLVLNGLKRVQLEV